MLIQPLLVRTRTTYRDGWSHLNPERFVCNAKLLKPRVTHHEDCMEEYTRLVAFLEVDDKSLSLGEVAPAIRDTLTYSGCRHEYDCCGCWSTRVTDVKRVGRGRFSVLLSRSRNY